MLSCFDPLNILNRRLHLRSDSTRNSGFHLKWDIFCLRDESTGDLSHVGYGLSKSRTLTFGSYLTLGGLEARHYKSILS